MERSVLLANATAQNAEKLRAQTETRYFTPLQTHLKFWKAKTRFIGIPTGIGGTLSANTVAARHPTAIQTVKSGLFPLA
jgi:hypothetical protein